MHGPTLKSLEFDRIVSVVAGLAATPTGHDRLIQLHPMTDAPPMVAALRATTEGAKFLADYPGFPLRAPSDLEQILEALNVDGRALEPSRLFGLSEYLESIEQSRHAVKKLVGFPILNGLVDGVASFKGEIAEVRRKIDPSGEVADNASPALASIRDRLRRQKTKLRSTLDSFVRGRDTAKYLQDQVVTDRNGRFVLMVRAEHRQSIPGIVHGGSASGASLYVEPLATIEINNDIVALEEQEAEEVRRILLALTDNFRGRPHDLQRTVDVATELDVIQARARFSQMVDGIEPYITQDGSLELRGARHPLLMHAVRRRLQEDEEAVGQPVSGSPREADTSRATTDPVPVDLLLSSPNHVLVITGPNTGGKTVALKTAGLFVAMAQAGLHLPVDPGSRLPVFKSMFADIGDEQSIANSLSTFSAHITNVVAMDRNLRLPALVLLDEVGAGTDPAEGGALGTAVIDHFRRRGAHVVATTHYDSLKSYASATDGVVSAAFGFNPGTFAPTYRLLYGSPGRSLAIEIAARHGLPPSVIAAARENLTEREKQLADHLARVDQDLHRLQEERRTVMQERAAVAEAGRQLRAREESIKDKEATLRKRLDARIDDQVREARREIDAVIEGLKARAAQLSQQAAVRLRTGETVRAAGISTGETGEVRGEARAALDNIVARLKGGAPAAPDVPAAPPAPVEVGARVSIGGLGVEGTVVEIHGKQAAIDVRGRKMRAPLQNLRVLSGPTSHQPRATTHVNVDLRPREGSISELNVIGCTVDEALTRLDKFLDDSIATDQHELRIVHGHGTGQLRRAIGSFLKEHPLVANIAAAPQNQGGGGATIVELKD
ncbi:MAG TPA: endonuclease MutS2 [Vicinamibacterales bacterium]|nr:endonuclease MutS2 [Vicinamibacterales bacterium]